MTDLRASMLVMDPFNPQALYAVTSEALFRSGDGGASWTTSLAGTFSGYRNVAFDPVLRQTLYVASGKNVFRSADDGASWIEFSDGLGEVDFVSGLLVDPTHPHLLCLRRHHH